MREKERQELSERDRETKRNRQSKQFFRIFLKITSILNSNHTRLSFLVDYQRVTKNKIKVILTKPFSLFPTPTHSHTLSPDAMHTQTQTHTHTHGILPRPKNVTNTIFDPLRESESLKDSLQDLACLEANIYMALLIMESIVRCLRSTWCKGAVDFDGTEVRLLN